MDKEELERVIRAAFAGVELGEGIGLREGNAIDDYESDAEQAIQRQHDEKHDWARIPVDDLHDYQYAVSYFDPAGMRFHLPAFMLAEIQGESDTILFHLIRLDEYSLSRFTALSPQQRVAVAAFLYWSLEQEINSADWLAIERALLEYWEPSR